MRLLVEELKGSLDKVQKMVGDNKNPLGVLLRKEDDDNLAVCYSDGKKAMVDIITMEDGSGLDSDVILPYKNFIDTVNSYANSGDLRTQYVDLEFNSESTIVTLSAVCELIIKTGEFNEDNEEIVNYKVANIFKDKIKYINPETSGSRYEILTRCDYTSIISLDDYDEWNKSNLQTLLNKLNKEDGKICYIASKLKAGFVANTAYVSLIPTEDVDRFGFTATSRVAKCIVDVLSKVATNKVYVYVEDSRYCRIMADDGKFGVWFEVAPGKPIDANKLAKYQKVKTPDGNEVDRQYNDYRLVMNRASIAFAVKRALNSDKNDSSTLQVVNNGDSWSVVLNNDKNREASDNRLVLDACSDTKGDIEELRLPFSLKLLSDIVNSCSGEVIIMAFENAEDNKSVLLKIGDVSRDKENKTAILGSYYTMVAKK